MGLCPFHQEKTPSFSVVPHKGIFHCFGCGEGGDVFKFLMKVQGMGFLEAVKELAAPAGVTIEERLLSTEEKVRLKRRATLYEVCGEAAGYYQNVLLVRPEGGPGRKYLQQRGIGDETIRRYRIGYAPVGWSNLTDYLHSKGISAEQVVEAGLARRSERGGGAYDIMRGRVVFPILDSRERPISFGGRIVDQSSDSKAPKYINGPETDIYVKSRTLYGLSLARREIQQKDRVILVEGYFDVVSLGQGGFPETVATCGTALTVDHLKSLRTFTRKVIALFDADEAGLRAAERAMPIFADAGIDAFRLEIPGAKDPDEYINTQGAQAFAARLEDTEPLVELLLRRAALRFGPSPMGRQQALESLAPIVARFPPLARSVIARRIADVLYLPEQRVMEGLERQASRRGKKTEVSVAAQSFSAQVLPPEVKDLFWLVIHYPDTAVPLVAAFDPDLFSSRLDVKECMAGLLEGRSLAAVLEDLPDTELCRVLREASANEDLYTEEHVDRAVRQILARLELKDIQHELSSIHQHLATCSPALDRARYLELIRRRVELQHRQRDLVAIRQGTFS